MASLRFWAVLLGVLSLPSIARATPPPFELAVAKVRESRKVLQTMTLRVTYLGKEVVEKKGSLKADRTIVLGSDVLSSKSAGANRALWIALAAADPVSEIQTKSVLDSKHQEIRADERQIVFTYGTIPSFSLGRTTWNLVAFLYRAGGVVWKTNLTWEQGHVVSVRVSRAGRVVLTAKVTTQ